MSESWRPPFCPDPSGCAPLIHPLTDGDNPNMDQRGFAVFCWGRLVEPLVWTFDDVEHVETLSTCQQPRRGDGRMTDPLQLPETGIEPRSLASQTNGYRPRTARHVYRAALLAAGVALVLAGVAVGRATATPRTAGIPVIGDGSFRLLEAPLLHADSGPDSTALAGASLPPPPSTTGTRPALGEDSPDLRTPPATSDIGTALESGTASFVDPSYGSRYLALPEGPGVRVTICHGSVCVIRTSTDAGPDKAMQRAGRVADVSWADFRRLCRCDPYVVGLLRVTVDYGGPSVTPPATDR